MPGRLSCFCDIRAAKVLCVAYETSSRLSAYLALREETFRIRHGVVCRGSCNLSIPSENFLHSRTIDPFMRVDSYAQDSTFAYDMIPRLDSQSGKTVVMTHNQPIQVVQGTFTTTSLRIRGKIDQLASTHLS